MFTDLQALGTDASLEAVLYPMYYRRHGVRRAVQLVAPPLANTSKLELPRGSILHYVPDDESQYGIPQDDPILANQSRLIMVEHITELADQKGPPRPTMIPPTGMIRDYHRRYRMTRRMLKFEMAVRDPRTVVIENYALLPHLYRYVQNVYVSYNKWWNIQATMWENMGRIGSMTDRQQYLVCRLPKQLPALGRLRTFEQRVSGQLVKYFPKSEDMFLLELWKWLGEYRQDSVIAKCPPEALKNINLIWVDGQQWYMMNLGMIDEWRKPSKLELEAGANPEAGVVKPEPLQRRVLRGLMTLMEGRAEAVGEDEGTLVDETVVESTPGAETPAAAADVPTDTPVEVEAEKSRPLTITVQDDDSGKSRTMRVTKNLDVDKLPELDTFETPEMIQKIDDAILKDLSALDAKEPKDDESSDELVYHETEFDAAPPINYVPGERDYVRGVMNKVDALADVGLVSGAEYRRFSALAESYKQLDNPYGAGKLEDQLTVPAEDLQFTENASFSDNPVVLDKSMLKSSLNEFDEKYITKVMSKDMVRMVMGLQHAGIAITGYSIEPKEDAMGASEEHTVTLAPVRGKASTVRFTVPRVEADGTFRSKGVRYRLRKQRGDMPIRKLAPGKVALTSYYSKIFVTRSERQTNNYTNWITNRIVAAGMDVEDDRVTVLMISKVFDQSIRTPRIYSILATRMRSFTAGRHGYDFFVDYHARHAHFGEALVNEAEQDGMLVAGRKGKQLILVDQNDMFYLRKGADLELLGRLESILDLTGTPPVERAEVKVFNKQVPVGIFLGYHLGLTQLLSVLGVRHRWVPSGERMHLSDDEYAIRFEDQALIVPTDHRVASLILAGFNAFDKIIRNYPAHLFDKKDIYLSILENGKIGMRYLREMDLMLELFVDPITEEILKEMNEPTDFVGLLFRSCELLTTDWSPLETDMEYMRIRGYERIPGTVYTEMVKAIRAQRAKGMIANTKIDMPPYIVSQTIHEDPAVSLVEESNPIHNLKEKEELTYSGNGGRSSQSMVSRTRVFHPNDMGVVSEATKDSKDVAVTTFLTADPNLKNLRGVTEVPKEENLSATSMISTSALLAPAADRDDPKRVNFISIQQSQCIAAEGYQALPLRTGYEAIIAERVDDLFAYTAKGPGKVTRLTPRSIQIVYENGESVVVELGRRFGIASSLTLPHMVVTNLILGDTVEAGDAVAYNRSFFEPDLLNPKRVIWKGGALLTTAIMESTDTLEDSSAISEEAAHLMSTQTTMVRDIVVAFDQVVHNLVNIGEDVDVESILCTIEDALTAQSDLFDEDSLDTLRHLATNSPRAKAKGLVEKIEVFYHGDLEDMNESLQEIARESDKNRKRRSRELGKPTISGRVTDSMSVNGEQLAFEHAVVRIYITGTVAAGVGDKGVFGNQMKTIFGRVMSGTNETQSGTKIDAIFGYTSISNRIIRSPEIMGTTTTLLKVISKHVAKVYRGK